MVENRVTALKTNVAAIDAYLASLPKIINDAIARQVETVIAQVTQGISRIIQK